MYVTTGLHGGGAERLLTNLLVGHRDARESVSVVALTPGGVFRAALEEAGVHVVDLGMQRRRDALRACFKLASLIRAQRPEIVHGWMYHGNLLALFALVLAGRRGTRLFWGIFCSELPADRFHWSFRVVRRMSALLSRFVEAVVYNAAEARDFHDRIGFRPGRSLLIPNYVDREAFRTDASGRDATRAELGLEADDVVVTVAARVDPMKDWSTVREAVRDLPGIVTVAIGAGTDALPRQENFVALGWRDDVARIFNASDIFLLASAFGEGASLALNEAMLCSLPCIVTDVGGNRSLVGDGGVVVEPCNAPAIRAAIVALASDRGRRLTLGKAAFERASAAESYSSIFERLVLPAGCDGATA